MAFVQIIEFHTSKLDEMKKLGDQWSEEALPTATARRGLICEDRENPGHCFQVVFFDSFESAMKNSELPITQEFAQKMAALADGSPNFYNLNVVDDRTW